MNLRSVLYFILAQWEIKNLVMSGIEMFTFTCLRRFNLGTLEVGK